MQREQTNSNVDRGMASSISFVSLLIISAFLLIFSFFTYPTLTTVTTILILIPVVVIALHAWYTRRKLKQSFHIFTQPIQKQMRYLYSITESIRRDTPPPENVPSSSQTPIEDAKQQYVNGNLSEHQFEEKIEQELSTDELDQQLQIEKDRQL